MQLATPKSLLVIVSHWHSADCPNRIQILLWIVNREAFVEFDLLRLLEQRRGEGTQEVIVDTFGVDHLAVKS